MKIIQLLTQATGGPADHSVDLALGLAEAGHDLLVVLGDGPAARRLDAAGVRRTAVGPRSKGDVSGMAELARVLRAEHADVLHAQDRRAGLVTRSLRPLLAASTVAYTLHGVPDSLSGRVAGNLQVAPRRRRDRLLYVEAERALALAGRGPVLVPSRALADYAVSVLRLPARLVRVATNGVDATRFAPGPRQRAAGRLDVSWLGAVVPTKGLACLLDAAATVDGLHLHLGGTGELEAELRGQATRLGLTDRVHWLGWVDDPAALLAAADVFALPSRAENLPLALLQGMSSAAACVASRVGGIPEVVTDGVDGLLCPPGDVPAWSAALTRLRDDPALRDQLGAAARQRVLDRFDLPLSTAAVLAAYEEFLCAS